MSKKVLVVDDDRNVQRTLAEALEMEGFDVLREKDGEWAVKTFSSKKPDAVILDVLIPIFNGFQVAEKIRALPDGAQVPLIMVSGIYRGMNHRIDAKKRFDVLEYLDKPVRIEQVIELLKQVFADDYPAGPRKAAAPRAPAEPAKDPYADRETAAEAKEAEKLVRSAMKTTAESAISGDLKDTAFPQLLHRLHRDRLSGALLLKRNKIKKIVYFRDGFPVSVKSNLLNECLGRILVEENIISEAQCQESIHQMQRSKRQQGTILIEMGAISPHNLNWALQQQLETKLYDIFAWPQGEYRFSRQAEVPGGTVGLESTPAELVYEGLRRKFDPDRIRAELDAVARKFVDRSPDPVSSSQDLGLDGDEEAFLLQLDGTQSVYDLITYGPLGELHARQLLYALHAVGMVQLLDVARIPPAPEESGPPPLREVSSVRAQPQEVPRLDRIGRGEKLTLTEEERNTRERLAKYFMDIKNKDYFQILGVSQSASRWEIKKAFLELAKEFHPDKHYGTATKEIKEIAEEIFAILSKAHDVLTDDSERTEYLRQLTGGQPRDVSDEVNKILAAEGQFQKGEALLRRRKYEEAAACFQEAVNLYGDEGEFHAYLGWARYQSDPRTDATLKKARQHLQNAIRLNPKLDRAYLFLGFIYKAKDQWNLAEQQFEKAIQCNPDCTEALQELRLISRARKRR